MPEAHDTDARLTIVEYRMDQAEGGLKALRADYTEEHAALRKSLQGIEKNLQTIKWVACGAGLAFASQTLGLAKALTIIKSILTLT
jgi:hypothetical protein